MDFKKNCRFPTSHLNLHIHRQSLYYFCWDLNKPQNKLGRKLAGSPWTFSLPRKVYDSSSTAFVYHLCSSTKFMTKPLRGKKLPATWDMSTMLPFALVRPSHFAFRRDIIIHNRWPCHALTTTSSSVRVALPLAVAVIQFLPHRYYSEIGCAPTRSHGRAPCIHCLVRRHQKMII